MTHIFVTDVVKEGVKKVATDRNARISLTMHLLKKTETRGLLASLGSKMRNSFTILNVISTRVKTGQAAEIYLVLVA